MTAKIQRADEVADFLSCLADIDDIFSPPVLDVILAAKKKSKRFETRRSADTLKDIAAAFLLRLMTLGVSLDISLAA